MYKIFNYRFDKKKSNIEIISLLKYLYNLYFLLCFYAHIYNWQILNANRILKKENLVGFTTGIAIGAAIAVIGYLWERNFMFGIVIGTAMILNMVVATIAGFIVPVILKKVNVDPALASAVFVTTVTDVLGFFFFLGLATIFISYLN